MHSMTIMHALPMVRIMMTTAAMRPPAITILQLSKDWTALQISTASIMITRQAAD